MTATKPKIAEITVNGLTMPDLRPYFKHLHWRPMPHSYGVPVASDFADYPEDHPVFGLYKQCGLWTMDEAAILYNVAKQMPGQWLDVGCHTMWCTAHLAAADLLIAAIDPMFRVSEFLERARANIYGGNDAYSHVMTMEFARTADEFFSDSIALYGEAGITGVVIDGDHDRPHPMNDAVNSLRYLNDRGVILMHDAVGLPVQEAVLYLVSQGMRCKVYPTPHCVALCWRGELEPPIHTANPAVFAGVWRDLGRLRAYV